MHQKGLIVDNSKLSKTMIGNVVHCIMNYYTMVSFEELMSLSPNL